MSVYQLGGLRIIDLSKPIDPATETRLCELERSYGDGPVPGYGTKLRITSHLGTHVECPSHQHDGWPSVGELPLTHFLGRGLYVNLQGIAPRSDITAADLERCCGDRVRPGDILILDSPYRIAPFTPLTETEQDERLIPGREASEWMAGRQVKAVGFGDGVTVECPREGTTLAMHEILLGKNIVFLEVLQNLDQLQSESFLLAFLPVPIRGLDSCPVRAVAIEGIPGF